MQEYEGNGEDIENNGSSPYSDSKSQVTFLFFPYWMNWKIWTYNGDEVTHIDVCFN